jgi:AAA domain
VNADERRRWIEARLIDGAQALTANVTAYEALLRGVPVARDRLDAEMLTAIGEPLEGEPIELSEELALRVLVAKRRSDRSSVQPVQPEEPELELRVVTAEEFAAVDEPGAAALLGGENSAVLSEGGDVMVYGDGGVGKTSLAVDGACHLAAGDDWLEIQVDRHCRVLLIENEGPRAQFRRKLARKLEAWPGSPIGDRLLVLEEPWGQFSYADPVWRQRLAEVVRAREVDVAIVGPLTASGMDLPGTLQDCRAFLSLVDKVRDLSGRPFANVLIHHENRGGKVSGAWEGAGDTLLHVQQQGRGKLRLYFQKARWSSEHHGTTLQLVWAEGEGFALAEGEPARPERVWDDIADFVLAHGGCSWNDVDGDVVGDATYKRRRRDAMLGEGVLINVGRGQTFELWHRDDPARPTLDTVTALADERGHNAPALNTGDVPGSRTALPRCPRKGNAASNAVGSQSPGDPESSDAAEGGREEEAP